MGISEVIRWLSWSSSAFGQLESEGRRPQNRRVYNTQPLSLQHRQTHSQGRLEMIWVERSRDSSHKISILNGSAFEVKAQQWWLTIWISLKTQQQKQQRDNNQYSLFISSDWFIISHNQALVVGWKAWSLASLHQLPSETWFNNRLQFRVEQQQQQQQQLEVSTIS